jgi:hypothetical protein
MNKWIPLTVRDLDEEEKKYYSAEIVEYGKIFNCTLPDDCQEVLISCNGCVSIDTFYNDGYDGCSFDSAYIDDVDAWMPLPEPYKAESEVQE